MVHNLKNCPKCQTPFYAQGLASHLRGNNCRGRAVATPTPAAPAARFTPDQERLIANVTRSGKLTREAAIAALGY